MVGLAVLLASLCGCTGPTHDESVLRAIKAEAGGLMVHHAAQRNLRLLPKAEWPPVIASLRPHDVLVSDRTVDIIVRAGFDGGWGYEIPRNRQDLGMPPACYSEPSAGVFWRDPC